MPFRLTFTDRQGTTHPLKSRLFKFATIAIAVAMPIFGALAQNQRTAPIPPPPPAAQPRDGAVFQDWITRCERIELQGRAQERCYLSQTQTTQEGQRIIQLNIGYIGPNRELAGVVFLPLGIYLPAGAAYRIDQGPQVAIQIESCIPEGCRAAFLIDDTAMRALRAAPAIHFGFLSEPNGKSLLLSASLRGFSQGIATLKP